MDIAVQCIHGVAPRTVTAREVAESYTGKAPTAIHFECPYCSRPVTICADDLPDDNRRFGPDRLARSTNSPSPYFRHWRADPFTHDCPYYRHGKGGDAEPQPPAIPMFLRRVGTTERFRLEFGIRRRGRGLAARLDDAHAELTVDGRPTSLAELVRGHTTIPLADPDLQPSRHIRIPAEWTFFVGRPEDGNGAFLFTDDYGSNGGRRIANGGAVHPDFDYYAVIGQSGVRTLQTVFDQAERVGTVDSPRTRLAVVRLRVHWSSPKRDTADRWPSGHGFRLTNFRTEATPVWPPQLRANGIDEPLFRTAMQIYQAPYIRSDDVMDATIEPHTLTSRRRPHGLREVGLLGFGQRRRQLPTQLEEYCCFLKTSQYLPWSGFMAAQTYPSGLQLADVPDNNAFTENSSQAHLHIPPPTSLDLRTDLRRRGNPHLDLAYARVGAPRQSLIPPTRILARHRTGIHTERGNEP
ncbi:hypothetical protein [Bifidobacterium cuniculi]|uniref:Uncharacterized protein n=1 Tax=Bifidobacterium cuniculi TaxID=1688 RepID=A0A087ATG5_9BIFI|nr:hypothetical protein [Bifidobacterium cuniculi]KFI62065.1 hypothetical protein BCUN_1381 [Bifidobacterium cuniculi]